MEPITQSAIEAAAQAFNETLDKEGYTAADKVEVVKATKLLIQDELNQKKRSIDALLASF